MKSIKFIFSSVLFVLLFSSCTDSSVQNSSPSLSGDIVGFVYVYNINGLRLADNSGIIVSCKSNFSDTSLVVGPNKMDTTNVDGRFVLPNLSTGSYNITYTKTGYATRKLIGYQFAAGGQAFLGTTTISEIPTYTVTGFTATATATTSYVTLAGNFTGVLPTITTKYFRYFVNTSSNVSSLPANYILTSSFSTTSTLAAFSFSTSSLSAASLASYGISAGQTIYIVAYADAYNSTSYVDLITGRYFYTAINPVKSNFVSMVVQ